MTILIYGIGNPGRQDDALGSLLVDAMRDATTGSHAWGHEFEDVYQNCIRSHEGPNRPAPVDSFPMDESPYGVRGMGGNATDWCLNDLDDGRKLLRGGSWLTYGLSLRLTARMAGAPTRIGHANGFRLALLCRIPLDPPEGGPEDGGARRERDRR